MISMPRQRRVSTKYVSPKYIADELEVAPKTILQEVLDGKIPAIKVGRVYKIRVEDYEEYKKKIVVQPRNMQE